MWEFAPLWCEYGLNMCKVLRLHLFFGSVLSSVVFCCCCCCCCCHLFSKCTTDVTIAPDIHDKFVIFPGYTDPGELLKIFL